MAGSTATRLHVAVCAKTDLPLEWTVDTAKANEGLTVAPLLEKLNALGIEPETCTMDKRYDLGRVQDACSERNMLPVVPLRQTLAVKRGTSRLERETPLVSVGAGGLAFAP
jgi:Transposase DDE domain